MAMNNKRRFLICYTCRWFGREYELLDGIRCPSCRAALVAESAEAIADRVRAAWAGAIARVRP